MRIIDQADEWQADCYCCYSRLAYRQSDVSPTDTEDSRYGKYVPVGIVQCPICGQLKSVPYRIEDREDIKLKSQSTHKISDQFYVSE